MTNTIENANTAAKKTNTARRRYDFRAVINRAAAESNVAAAAAARAAEIVGSVNAADIIRRDNFTAAESAARAAESAAANAANAAAAALNLENAKKPNGAKKFEKLEKLANTAAESAAAANTAANTAAENVDICTKAYTAAEKRDICTAEIYTKIDGLSKPAEIWAVIAEYGYTIIKRDFFIKSLGKEAGGAYWKDVNALALNCINAILQYANSDTKEDENNAFSAIRAYTARIGVKPTFNSDTVKTIANRAYTYKRLYGDGFTPNSIGGAKFIVEIIGAVTNPDALKKAAAESAAKKARRDSRKKAAAAKKSK